MIRATSTPCLALLVIACSSARDAPESDRRESAEEPARLSPDLIAEIARETDRAYALKRAGQNGPALDIFVAVEKKIAAAGGHRTNELASILDDQATVQLRLGKHAKAREIYDRAAKILAAAPKPNRTLERGIRRRLETLEVFERAGVRCEEGLTRVGDAGATLPYFPEKRALEAVFFEMSRDLTGCIDPGSRPVSVRMVVTGDGRIVHATTRGQLEGTKAGVCFAGKILSVAPKYRDKLPRFDACYRNFTFPFPIHD